MRMIPKYLKLSRKGHSITQTPITDADNGKTLADLGIYNREMLFAQRDDSIDPDVEKVPLVDGEGKFTE